MADPISIFDVIKRGGYEAALLTTFNVNFPFYEEVVLRRLAAVGVRHNVILVDARQCTLSWNSEASRPRMAGHSYTLLPVKVGGAFHPKICLLAGPKKASILIGSHNLTLAGFGFNREISNWIEVGGSKDEEGIEALADVWHLLRAWIQEQDVNLPLEVIESALAVGKFIDPLIGHAGPSKRPRIYGQGDNGPGLFAQLIENFPGEVERSIICGAFFDSTYRLIGKIGSRWPRAKLAVAIDPETVHLPPGVDRVKAKFVDARATWQLPHAQYLHAKLIYLEAKTGNALISGSANPSWPAWSDEVSHRNTEAVVVRYGAEATRAAADLGLLQLFDADPVTAETLRDAVTRTAKEIEQESPPTGATLIGIASTDPTEITVTLGVGRDPIGVRAFTAADESILTAGVVVDSMGCTHIGFDSNLEQVRSLEIATAGGEKIRVVVHHASILSRIAQTSRQIAIRNALGELGSADADISRLIATVEKVIFAPEVEQAAIKTTEHRKSTETGGELAVRPETLGVSIADMPKHKKKHRLLQSGDLAYVLDVLIRNLGREIESEGAATDRQGRTEEEQVGKDDDDVIDGKDRSTYQGDAEIARAISRKARLLIRRMIDRLAVASTKQENVSSAIPQLIAVLGILRELRRLRRAPRWRSHEDLAREEDRRALLDAAMRYLFGRKAKLMEKFAALSSEPLEEISYLRPLLLWLAWDLGDELTDQLDRYLERDDAKDRIWANSILYELLPAASIDEDEQRELRRSLKETAAIASGSANRAEAWISRHLAIGKQIAMADPKLFVGRASYQVGRLAQVPKSSPPRLRVVSNIANGTVTFNEFDSESRFLNSA